MQINNQITPDAHMKTTRIQQNGAMSGLTAQQKTQSASAKNFADVLSDKLTGAMPLHFSKHANMRLSSREINLTNEQLQRVEEGISKANQKGVRDSLVLVDNVALVVNVRSKTVITAVDQQQANENIFTNIDGAVIV